MSIEPNLKSPGIEPGSPFVQNWLPVPHTALLCVVTELAPQYVACVTEVPGPVHSYNHIHLSIVGREVINENDLSKLEASLLTMQLTVLQTGPHYSIFFVSDISHLSDIYQCFCPSNSFSIMFHVRHRDRQAFLQVSIGKARPYS
jgi:hypothetical protein